MGSSTASTASGASASANLVFSERELAGVDAVEVDRDESGCEKSRGEDDTDEGRDEETLLGRGWWWWWWCW